MVSKSFSAGVSSGHLGKTAHRVSGKFFEQAHDLRESSEYQKKKTNDAEKSRRGILANTMR